MSGYALTVAAAIAATLWVGIGLRNHFDGVAARHRTLPDGGPAGRDRIDRYLRPVLGVLPGVDRRVDDLPVLVGAIAASLRTGATLRTAIVEAQRSLRGPLSDEVAEVLARVERGSPLMESLRRWGADRGDREVDLLVAAASVALETGGPLAQSFEDLADGQRVRRQLEAEVRAMAAQARVSVWFMVAAPVLFTVATATADGRVTRFLLTTPAGWGCLVGGLGLDSLGVWWMRRLMGRVR